ncbi:unnamed protein product, partial [marine sediment metagenome]
VEDTLVKLTPVPTDDTWVFAAWSGPNVDDLVFDGIDSWDIIIDNDKELTAKFTGFGWESEMRV